MKLDYTVPKQVSINMTDYVKSMVENFPQEELLGKGTISLDKQPVQGTQEEPIIGA